MSLVQILDRLLMGLILIAATAGCIFTFQRSYQTSSLVWSLAYLFAMCRLLISEPSR